MFSSNFWTTLSLYSNMGNESCPGTPRKLANEVLDKLPSHPWSDPNKTFLEPCFSNGTLYFLMIERLFYGLENVIPDPKERIKHILTKQVWAHESHKIPFDFVKKMLSKQLGIGEEVDIEPNLCYNNIMEGGLNMKFSVVAMNAPYNKPVHHKGRKGGYGGRTLWDKYLHKAIDEWVEDDGYLCSINPSSWRKPPTKKDGLLYQKITSNQVKYLEINSKKRGQEVFKASTRFDCIILQKRPCTEPTVIVDEERQKHSIMLPNKKWIANYHFQKVNSLLAEEGEEKCEVIFSASIYDTRKPYVSTNKGGPHIHPVIHTMPIVGYKCVYTSDKTKGHFGVPKVILSFNEKQHEPLVDYKGEFGMSQIAFGIKIDSEADGKKLANFIKSDQFKEILKATKWSTFQTDWRMFTYFKQGFWR